LTILEQDQKQTPTKTSISIYLLSVLFTHSFFHIFSWILSLGAAGLSTGTYGGGISNSGNNVLAAYGNENSNSSNSSSSAATMRAKSRGRIGGSGSHSQFDSNSHGSGGGSELGSTGGSQMSRMTAGGGAGGNKMNKYGSNSLFGSTSGGKLWRGKGIGIEVQLFSCSFLPLF
jgi:hypothetical protein